MTKHFLTFLAATLFLGGCSGNTEHTSSIPQDAGISFETVENNRLLKHDALGITVTYPFFEETQESVQTKRTASINDLSRTNVSYIDLDNPAFDEQDEDDPLYSHFFPGDFSISLSVFEAEKRLCSETTVNWYSYNSYRKHYERNFRPLDLLKPADVLDDASLVLYKGFSEFEKLSVCIEKDEHSVLVNILMPISEHEKANALVDGITVDGVSIGHRFATRGIKEKVIAAPTNYSLTKEESTISVSNELLGFLVRIPKQEDIQYSSESNDMWISKREAYYPVGDLRNRNPLKPTEYSMRISATGPENCPSAGRAAEDLSSEKTEEEGFTLEKGFAPSFGGESQDSYYLCTSAYDADGTYRPLSISVWVHESREDLANELLDSFERIELAEEGPLS